MQQNPLPEEVFAQIRARAALAFDELTERLHDIPGLIEGDNPLAVLGALDGIETLISRIRVLMSLIWDLRTVNAQQSKISFPKGGN